MQTSQQTHCVTVALTVRDTELVWWYVVAARLAATSCPLWRMQIVTFQSSWK